MKCKYCGADLTMEDEVCPFCHNPNPYYVKHREDMHRYEQDYQETKSDVYETAGKTSRKATQIADFGSAGRTFPWDSCVEYQYLDCGANDSAS